MKLSLLSIVVVMSIFSCVPSSVPTSSLGAKKLDQEGVSRNILRLLNAAKLENGVKLEQISTSDVPPKLLAVINNFVEGIKCEYFTRVTIPQNSSLNAQDFLYNLRDNIKSNTRSLLLAAQSSSGVGVDSPFFISNAIEGFDLKLTNKRGYFYGISESRLTYPNFIICVI